MNKLVISLYAVAFSLCGSVMNHTDFSTEWIGLSMMMFGFAYGILAELDSWLEGKK